jgi:DNA invertase Pin-like site-specific DNA recombinase
MTTTCCLFWLDDFVRRPWERTKAGVAAAKARGRSGGRPAKLIGERAEHARNLLAAGSSVSSVARSMGVSRAAVHRAMERIAEAE